MTGVGNILRVFDAADEIDLAEGLAAYYSYRETMVGLAREYGYTLEQTTGAFSALSPNNDYVGNVRSLVSVMRAHKAGRPFESVTVSSYGHCARRAWRVLDGEDFLSFTKGPKTRSFFLNIVSPWLPHVVTIDGHMVSVWHGRRFRMQEVGTKEARFNYERVADDFRRAAMLRGLLANQVQAICWFAWKRINGIVYESQLSLLTPGDQWGLKLAPEDIRPFAGKAGGPV